ncbi:MAG: chromosomal replication initiation protein DnaA, partial [Legionellales bacterium]|nr:chromosomal replication initiation protein DnaA [Legionellales bacterium]
METTPWKHCLEQLEGELSTQQFDTWIRPLHVIEKNGSVRLLAPNRFVQDWISERYLSRIQELLSNSHPSKEKVLVSLDVGSRKPKTENEAHVQEFKSPISNKTSTDRPVKNSSNNLNSSFTFKAFVEGNSNQLARAASIQVAENPGGAYNPLFICGGVGLGKTHLMHAIGWQAMEKDPSAKIAYLHSER